MAIVVSPLSRAPGLIQARKPDRVVSLLDPHTPFPVAPGYDDARHLKLALHDIVSAQPGLQAPDRASVARLIEFVAAWDQDGPLLIHCWAGVSRSTAAAFITACLHNPGGDEEEIAWRLRRASPTAHPNPRIVALGDDLLGRGGRMKRAAAAIGPGRPAWHEIGEAQPFEFPAATPAPP